MVLAPLVFLGLARHPARGDERHSGGADGAQLEDNLRAASLVLSEEEQGRLELATRPPLVYPYCINPGTPRTAQRGRTCHDRPYLHD